METFKEKLVVFKNSVVDLAKKAKSNAKKTCLDILDWAIDNPEAATAILVPTLCAAIRSGQSIVVSRRVKRQENRKDYSWYDPSTGLRWDLKRKMTNNDRQAIIQMKKSGFESIDILMKLNLI